MLKALLLAGEDRAFNGRNVAFPDRCGGYDIPRHHITHDVMMEMTDAQGLIAMIDARVKSERPRPEIQPVGKSRQRQVRAVQHGKTLTSAWKAGSQGEVP